MERFRLILEEIFGNFVSVLTGDVKAGIDKKRVENKIEKAFYRCGNFLVQFENTGVDSFGESVRVAFSRENLQSIYEKMKREKGYDIVVFIRQQLESICKVYGIEADNFINAFIELFKKCIYDYDRDLYDEMYQGEWRNEESDEHHVIIANQAQLITKLDGVEEYLRKVFSVRGNIPLISHLDNGQSRINTEPDDVLQEWELQYSDGRGSYFAENEKRCRMLELTEQWKKERLSAPLWYVLPRNKRYILKSYTCDEELLYLTESASLEEKFDFAYELVWRYESAFIPYDQVTQKEIRKIWKQIGDEPVASQKQEAWFYIGQALLREYREELDQENWNQVYGSLKNACSSSPNKEAELSLEKIKFLFMQMKIAETRGALLAFRGSESAFGVRLQVAGLKAECGLLSEAFQDLQTLERGLISVLQTDCNRENHIQYKSILASTYILQSYVLQALEPFKHSKELQDIWENTEQLKRYFNFEHEKFCFVQELYKRLKKEVESEPFELDTETKKIIFSSKKFSGAYDFFRLLDRIAMPLHIGYTSLLDDDSSDFIRVLFESYRYIGWFMLLRFGSTKTTEKTLGRKECIIINQKDWEGFEKAFDYVYDSVDGNISGIQMVDNCCYGEAYCHILLNGLEILRRLVSVANIRRQKKLISLLCKLNGSNVVREAHRLNRWIRQIMYVTEDRVKAVMLNELLTCSVKGTSSDREDDFLDPFEVFHEFIDARHYYQSADIDPNIIDDMISRASLDEKEKRSFISRLGQMAEWDLLTEKQKENFALLLWKDVPQNALLPYNNYYVNVYLRWPYPVGIDVKERIKHKLLNKENFDVIKRKKLSFFTFGENIYLQQILYLNRDEPDFWTTEEIEILVNGVLDCWQTLKQSFLKSKYPEIYKDEFSVRVKLFIRIICSFNHEQLRQMKTSVIECIKDMADEINEYGIEAVELSVLLEPLDNLSEIGRKISNGLRSADKEKAVASVNAAVKILYDCYQTDWGNDVLKEMIMICLYRKEPGLENCLIAIHNLLYSAQDIKLSDDSLNLVYEVLDNIDKQTDYESNLEKTEKEIKKLIQIRKACAGLAYRIYLYEMKNCISHSPEVLKWKNICRGVKSMKEFTEVKKQWLE